MAANATHIYWSGGLEEEASIGRARVDRSDTDPEFVEPSDCADSQHLRSPLGIAVDATHVYWVDTISVLIGRARLDGSSVECDWFAQPNPLFAVERDLAVDDEYLYWTQTAVPDDFIPGKIGRVEKSNPASFDRDFISGIGDVASVAVNETHIFWAKQTAEGGISKLPVDGSGTPQIVLAGGFGIAGIGLGGESVFYLTGGSEGIVGRVGIDAVSGVGEQVVSGIDNGFLLAVTTPAGTISPLTHDFGEVQIGQAASQVITLASTGDALLTIPAGGISVTGDTGDIGTTGGTCQAGSTALADGQSCTVVVAFEPSATGSKSATLQIATNDGEFSAGLSGTGTQAPGPGPGPTPEPSFTALKLTSKAKRVRAPRKGRKTVPSRVRVTNSGDATGTATVTLRSSSRKVRVPGRVRVQVPAGSSKTRAFKAKVLPRAPRKVTVTAKLPNGRSAKLVLRVKR